jgi:hypothetical protein
MNQLIFNKDQVCIGTSFADYLETPYSYHEAVARLYALVNYNIFQETDQYKSSFGITGTYKGDVFTLYDYKCDEAIHIGCHGACLIPELSNIELDIKSFKKDLLEVMKETKPNTAKYYYDEYAGTVYSYP